MALKNLPFYYYQAFVVLNVFTEHLPRGLTHFPNHNKKYIVFKLTFIVKKLPKKHPHTGLNYN